MGSAKDLVLRPIPSAEANEVVRRLHYSGKVVQNSQLHIGVYYRGSLEGAMQFGPSLDKRKMIGLVDGTRWDGFLELNRMAFSEALPRNSESRAIAVAMRLIRQHAPQVEWVVSFADATQCGDGTIYRASGFVLTGIKENNQIWAPPEYFDDGGGARESRTSLTDGRSKGEQAKARSLLRSRDTATKGNHITGPTHAIQARGELGLLSGGAIHSASARPGIGAIGNAASTNGASSMRPYIEAGWRPLEGFQLRYIYFLNPEARDRLTVDELPFEEIERRGAAMYRGEKVLRASGQGDTSATSRAGRFDSDPDAPSANEATK